MATIFDYLEWRGDLKINQACFNNIDALILSRLSYIPFDGIVLSELSDNITIGKAADIFFTLKDPVSEVNMPKDIDLLKALAKNERFKNMRLSGYVNEVDYESQKQFSAIVIDTGDDLHFVSYRGTDNTLVGWKEDFNMSFMTPVPAQKEAVRYLEKIVGAISGYIRIGGHSKGGNLAVYAASFCPESVQERIVKVYNNDGPGFDSTITAQKGYAAICERIQTFVPQSSIVGMLLEHEEAYIVIHSTQIGLLQHDVYSWKVLRDNFVYLDTVSNSSIFVDKTLKDWMSVLEPEQREQFIEAMFSIFSETDAQTIKELTAKWYKNALLVLKSLKNMDESFKQIISQVLLLLIKSAKQNLLMFKPKGFGISTKHIEPKS